MWDTNFKNFTLLAMPDPAGLCCDLSAVGGWNLSVWDSKEATGMKQQTVLLDLSVVRHASPQFSYHLCHT